MNREPTPSENDIKKNEHIPSMFTQKNSFIGKVKTFIQFLIRNSTQHKKQTHTEQGPITEEDVQDRFVINVHKAIPALNALLSTSLKPVLSTTDTEQVQEIIEEFISAENDTGHFREQIKKLPTDPVERNAVLTRLLHELADAGIIQLQEEQTSSQDATHHTPPYAHPFLETIETPPETMTLKELKQHYAMGRVPHLSLGDATVSKLTYMLDNLPLRNGKRLREAFVTFSATTNADERTLGFQSILYHIALEEKVLLSTEDCEHIEKFIYRSSKEDFENFLKRNNLL